MSDEQQEQLGAGDRWGDPIGDKRKAELGKLFEQQETWAATPEAERGGQASHFQDVRLTGAEVAWLAEQSRRDELRGVPNLHLEGATLRFAQLEGANLSSAHLEGATLDAAFLEGATLAGAYLEGATLAGAHLERAFLGFAHLERADLNFAFLEGATLIRAHLEGATLDAAFLEGALLAGAHLEGAFLTRAHLERADLTRAHLERADLRSASFDKTSRLNLAQLDGGQLDQVIFDNTNLAVVEWDVVLRLGDERVAEQATDANGKRKSRATRAYEYEAAVRAYRLLATALQANGLGDVAARYSYRAKIMERKQRWYQRRLSAYLASGFLALLAGYGYRLGRVLFAYVLVVALFAGLFWLAGVSAHGTVYRFDVAAQVSLNAIHGRVFFTSFGLDTLQSWIATTESVVGIVIEGLFVAVLIQRLFSR